MTLTATPTRLTDRPEIIDIVNFLPADTILDNASLINCKHPTVQQWLVARAHSDAQIVLLQVNDAYVAYGSDALQAFAYLKITSTITEGRFWVKCYDKFLPRAIARAAEQGITLKVVTR